MSAVLVVRTGQARQVLEGPERESVFHILKGGEDSVGDLLAVQRVYINIGSCSEQCWLNHPTDLYRLDRAAAQFRADAV